MEVLYELLTSCAATFCPAAVPALLPVETLHVNGRVYRVVKQLGEGGYAFVLLAKELPSPERPFVGSSEAPVAIKKILAASGDKLRDAKREIEVLQQLSHPNCLPLLDSAINTGSSSSNGSSSSSSLSYTVLLVFPAFEDGTLAEEVERLAAAGRRLSSADVLHVFGQVCAGVAHMHARGYAHMDVKPHNMLIRRPRQQPPQQQQVAPPRPGRGMARDSDAGGADDDDGGGGDVSRSLVCRRYEAVLTDFGSARRLPLELRGRPDALALQEEAEAHCTATFRAPELFDVPSHGSLGGGMDVWALGCTLYAIMYGASPFQQALDQGASLALAVMNCRIPWPKPPVQRYPQQLHDLVSCCLHAEPASRPTAAQLLQRVQDTAAALDGDAGPAAAG